MRQVDQEVGARQAKNHRVTAQIKQRSRRVRARPTEDAPVFPCKRFRQHEPAVKPVKQRESAGDYERNAQPNIPEQTAQGRPEDESQTKCRADQSEIRRALLRRTYVRDIGSGGGEVGARNSGDNAADKEPAEIGCKG